MNQLWCYGDLSQMTWTGLIHSWSRKPLPVSNQLEITSPMTHTMLKTSTLDEWEVTLEFHANLSLSLSTKLRYVNLGLTFSL